MVNAQQLSTVSDKVLRRFGDTATTSPSAPIPPAQLDHFVSIALGNTGGALVIGADSETAAQLASKMFDKPPHQLQLRDWIDALSELSNMVAGQLEFRLGSERSLGIPVYMSADSRSQIWPAVIVETEVWSSFAGHAFYFAVLAEHVSPQVQAEDN
ncbi:MAG: chemotaxis protein CheX [Spongiibacteraceae bacterium]